MKYFLSRILTGVLAVAGASALFGQSVLANDIKRAKTISAPSCGGDIACALGQRSYHYRLPDGWDGKSALPVMLHFHGWGRQGKLIVNHSRIAGATRKLGVLLLAPNGLGRSWNFWTAQTDDVGFAKQVLEDAAKRFPVDRSRIFISGYSYGGAMAWRFACAGAMPVKAILAISGSLRGDETCATPVNFRHVHGIRDTVLSYPYGEEGGVESAVRLWRQRNGCDAKPSGKLSWQAVEILSFERYVWSNCRSGKNVVLDVHSKGHFIPRFWIERQLKELL